MLVEEFEKYTDEQIVSLIAEVCGFELPLFNEVVRGREIITGWKRDGMKHTVPDYLHDLNACYEFEELLGDNFNEYARLLQGLSRYAASLMPISVWDLIHADARTRCRAFLLVMTED
jgi:hypothetical protein